MKHAFLSNRRFRTWGMLAAGLLVFLGVVVIAKSASALGDYNYRLLEPIPGFESDRRLAPGGGQFIGYVLILYQFGIWTVGIAAMFMLIIGGFMYITAAGNTSRVGTARGVITSSLVGLVAAFSAYLLFRVINPDLVNVNLDTLMSGAVTSTGSFDVNAPIALGGGGGTCTPDPSRECTVAKLTPTFGANATKASSICKMESGGDPAVESRTDRCIDNKSVSIGLFQINLTQHQISGLNCPSAFSGGPYTATNHNCRVTNLTLYQQCVTAAKNPATNIQKAFELSNNGTKWSPTWGANLTCKF